MNTQIEERIDRLFELARTDAVVRACWYQSHGDRQLFAVLAALELSAAMERAQAAFTDHMMTCNHPMVVRR